MDPKFRTACVGPLREIPRRPQKRFALLGCRGLQLGKEQGQGLFMGGGERGHGIPQDETLWDIVYRCGRIPQSCRLWDTLPKPGDHWR